MDNLIEYPLNHMPFVLNYHMPTEKAIVYGHINISNAMQYHTGYKLTNELDVFTHTSGLERRYEKV